MDLVGLSEIAAMLGVTRQVVTNWKTRKQTFPQPLADLKSGPVWAREAIITWANKESISIATEDTISDLRQTASRSALVAALMNMKGGVGKSTMTANVGWFAAYRKNLRVLMVDLDPQFNLSQYVLGIRGYEKLLDENAPTIDKLFHGSEDTAKSLVRPVADWDDGSCLHVIPAGLELAWAMRYAADKAHVLRDQLDELRSEYDLILIDCAPTESILSTAAYLASDFIFVPVKPEFLSTIGLPLLLRSIKEFRKSYKNETPPQLGGIIFNDTGEKVEHNRSREYVLKIAKENKWHVFNNHVSHSDSYPAGARVGKPIFLTDNARTWKKDEFNSVAEEFLKRMGL